jgi:Uma2 family endonuclease
VVRPDLMIICEDFPDRHLLSAPSLIAEVLSDATRNKDLTNKKQLYRENGVQYYLIADPQHASLQLFYRPAFGDAYREIRDEQPKVVFADGCRFHCQFNSIFQT